MQRLEPHTDFPGEDWQCDGGCERPVEVVHPPAFEVDGLTFCAQCVGAILRGLETARQYKTYARETTWGDGHADVGWNAWQPIQPAAEFYSALIAAGREAQTHKTDETSEEAPHDRQP